MSEEDRSSSAGARFWVTPLPPVKQIEAGVLDIGVDGGELRLDFADVGALGEQFGRQTRRDAKGQCTAHGEGEVAQVAGRRSPAARIPSRRARRR